MQNGIIVSVVIATFAAVTLLARSSPAESRVEERGTLPAPVMVILTSTVQEIGGGGIATVQNPGAAEGKLFFLETAHYSVPLIQVRMISSGNFPTGVIFHNHVDDNGVILASEMRFNPPLPVEIGVEVKTDGPDSNTVLYLTGFYGEGTNIIVNEGPMVVIPGDFNLDGRVDLNDFSTFANHFTG